MFSSISLGNKLTGIWKHGFYGSLSNARCAFHHPELTAVGAIKRLDVGPQSIGETTQTSTQKQITVLSVPERKKSKKNQKIDWLNDWLIEMSRETCYRKHLPWIVTFLFDGNSNQLVYLDVHRHYCHHPPHHLEHPFQPLSHWLCIYRSCDINYWSKRIFVCAHNLPWLNIRSLTEMWRLEWQIFPSFEQWCS